MTEKAGLNPVIYGKGLVAEQSLLTGSPLIKGSEIIINLKDTVQ